jgi:hypothetical protein
MTPTHDFQDQWAEIDEQLELSSDETLQVLRDIWQSLGSNSYKMQIPGLEEEVPMTEPVFHMTYILRHFFPDESHTSRLCTVRLTCRIMCYIHLSMLLATGAVSLIWRTFLPRSPIWCLRVRL